MQTGVSEGAEAKAAAEFVPGDPALAELIDQFDLEWAELRRLLAFWRSRLDARPPPPRGEVARAFGHFLVAIECLREFERFLPEDEIVAGMGEKFDAMRTQLDFVSISPGEGRIRSCRK